MSRETERREQLVQGLRDLADMIETGSLPVDLHEDIVVRHCVHARPARGVAEIDRIARLVDSPAETVGTRTKAVHTTRRRFAEALVYEARFERGRQHPWPESAEGPWRIRYMPAAEQMVELETKTLPEAIEEARAMRDAGLIPTKIQGPEPRIPLSGERLVQALNGGAR
jgi:hypothetical protein